MDNRLLKNPLSPGLLKKAQMSLDFARDREPVEWPGGARRAGVSTGYLQEVGRLPQVGPIESSV